MVDRAAQAAANAQPLGGDPVVSARSYLVQDVATNALILGLEYAGGPIGAPADPRDDAAVADRATCSAR